MNPNDPQWWGDLIMLEGDPLDYINTLYLLFKRDFIDTRPIFNNQQVHHDKNDDNGKSAGFVHITNKEDSTVGGRVLDLRRCERIHWIKPIIENAASPDVLKWREEKGKQKRVFLYLASERFLVILQEFKYGYLLVTAYYVDHEKTHQRYLKKNRRLGI